MMIVRVSMQPSTMMSPVLYINFYLNSCLSLHVGVYILTVEVWFNKPVAV